MRRSSSHNRQSTEVSQPSGNGSTRYLQVQRRTSKQQTSDHNQSRRRPAQTSLGGLRFVSYRPIATFSYTRKLKAVTPGRVRQFRLNGKRVKAVSPDGYKLQIIDAPASLVPRITTIKARGEKLSPYKDQLRIIRPKKRKTDGVKAKKPKPKPKGRRMKTPKPKETVQTTMPVHAKEKTESR